MLYLQQFHHVPLRPVAAHELSKKESVVRAGTQALSDRLHARDQLAGLLVIGLTAKTRQAARRFAHRPRVRRRDGCVRLLWPTPRAATRCIRGPARLPKLRQGVFRCPEAERGRHQMFAESPV